MPNFPPDADICGGAVFIDNIHFAWGARVDGHYYYGDTQNDFINLSARQQLYDLFRGNCRSPHYLAIRLYVLLVYPRCGQHLFRRQGVRFFGTAQSLARLIHGARRQGRLGSSAWFVENLGSLLASHLHEPCFGAKQPGKCVLPSLPTFTPRAFQPKKPDLTKSFTGKPTTTKAKSKNTNTGKSTRKENTSFRFKSC